MQTRHDKLIFVAESEDEKNEWIEAIQSAISEDQERNVQTNDAEQSKTTETSVVVGVILFSSRSHQGYRVALKKLYNLFSFINNFNSILIIHRSLKVLTTTRILWESPSR